MLILKKEIRFHYLFIILLLSFSSTFAQIKSLGSFELHQNMGNADLSGQTHYGYVWIQEGKTLISREQNVTTKNSLILSEAQEIEFIYVLSRYYKSLSNYNGNGLISFTEYENEKKFVYGEGRHGKGVTFNDFTDDYEVIFNQNFDGDRIEKPYVSIMSFGIEKIKGNRRNNMTLWIFLDIKGVEQLLSLLKK